MKTRHFFEYLPKRYDIRSERDQQVRNLVYGFKSGKSAACTFAAQAVSNFFVRSYGDRCNEYTLVCVPSSSNSAYRRRFSRFAAMVSDLCGVADAMTYVTIIGEKQPLHTSSCHFVCEDNYEVRVSADYFRGRKVIIFDDLITTGRTARTFAAQLTAAGAEVIGGLFLAETFKVKKGGQL